MDYNAHRESMVGTEKTDPFKTYSMIRNRGRREKRGWNRGRVKTVFPLSVWRAFHFLPLWTMAKLSLPKASTDCLPYLPLSAGGEVILHHTRSCSQLSAFHLMGPLRVTMFFLLSSSLSSCSLSFPSVLLQIQVIIQTTGWSVNMIFKNKIM